MLPAKALLSTKPSLSTIDSDLSPDIYEPTLGSRVHIAAVLTRRRYLRRRANNFFICFGFVLIFPFLFDSFWYVVTTWVV